MQKQVSEIEQELHFLNNFKEKVKNLWQGEEEYTDSFEYELSGIYEDYIMKKDRLTLMKLYAITLQQEVMTKKQLDYDELEYKSLNAKCKDVYSIDNLIYHEKRVLELLPMLEKIILKEIDYSQHP